MAAGAFCFLGALMSPAAALAQTLSESPGLPGLPALVENRSSEAWKIRVSVKKGGAGAQPVALRTLLVPCPVGKDQPEVFVFLRESAARDQLS